MFSNFYSLYFYFQKNYMNMKHNWSHFIGEISSMTNVTIICGDGIIHTHKIVVASASDFIKHLLSDIPVGDDITLYLPDHEENAVTKILDNILTNSQNKLNSEENIFDMLSNKDSVKNGIVTEIKEFKEEELDDDVKNEEDEPDLGTESSFEEMDESSNYLSEKGKSRGSYNVPKSSLDSYLQDVDNSIDPNKIRDLEKQIIQNPSTHNELKLNKKLSKQILLEKARLGVLK